MTRQAQCGASIINHEKTAELVIVRVMARGALQLPAPIQTHIWAQCIRVVQFTIRRDERGIVSERNRMVGGEIRAQVAETGWHRCGIHRDRRAATVDHAQRNGAVVTT